jgi:hypothetical protein
MMLEHGAALALTVGSRAALDRGDERFNMEA